MSTRQKEKKLSRLDKVLAEKRAIEERRKNRVEPALKKARQVVVALILTVLILYVGFMINSHLSGVVSRLTRVGI